MEFTKEAIEKVINEAIEKGVEHYRNNENDKAETLFAQILCVDSNNVTALQMLGLLESKLPDKSEQAIARLKKAESLEPDNPDVHNNLGLVYSWSDNKNLEEATKHYLRSIELNPKALHFYSNLGIHYKMLNRQQDAEEALLKGLSIEEASTMLHFNYATLLGEQKRWEEAKCHYRRAIELDPEFASAHYNLATVFLNEGNLKQGWREYEWRWETYPAFKKIFERFPKEKRWNGKSSLKKKRILLYAEQGVGDTIQFSRFVRELKKRGPYIIIEENSDLVSLMETLEGPNKVIALGDPIPPFDYHCSVVSLPYLLGLNRLDAVPNKPYLRCNYDELPELSTTFDEYWHVYDYFRLGIVWGGNPVHRQDSCRSTYLKNFKKLQLPGVKLFSLQKDIRPRYWPGIGERDLADGADGMAVVDMKDFMLDYNATASIIDRMDLIVAVDTATAHLAAAMGKPVWLLVAYHNDWRWGWGGSQTPWYPTMRLFRQPKPDDWDTVFQEVRVALNCLLS